MPDTCKCSFEYTDDGNFTPTVIHKLCSKHANLTLASIFTTILPHNQKKNGVRTHLTQNAATYNIPKHPNNQIDVATYYDPNAPSTNDPVLVVAPMLTAAQVASAQTQLDKHFGAGVVSISNTPPAPLPPTGG
jgi:hypothetical protein